MNLHATIAKAARKPVVSRLFRMKLPIVGNLVVPLDWANVALAHPGLQVPYGPASDSLGFEFVMSMAEAGPHGTARALVSKVLDDERSRRAHLEGLQEAAAVARAAMANSPTRIDAVAGVINPAVQAWAARWLGLPQALAPDALHVSRCVMHRVFMNPVLPGGKVNGSAAEAARQAVDAFRAKVEPLIDSSTSGVMGVLATSGLSRDEVVGNLIGLTVGPLALLTWALTESLMELTARESEAGVLSRTLAHRCANAEVGLTPSQSEVSLGLLFLELARLRSPVPIITRSAPVRVELRSGEDPARQVRGRTIVMTQAAMMDPTVFTRPTTCDPERFRAQAAPHLAFGGGMHACMGMMSYARLASVVLSPILAGGVVSLGRTAKPKIAARPTGIKRGWNYPGSLVVDIYPDQPAT